MLTGLAAFLCRHDVSIEHTSTGWPCLEHGGQGWRHRADALAEAADQHVQDSAPLPCIPPQLLVNGANVPASRVVLPTSAGRMLPARRATSGLAGLPRIRMTARRGPVPGRGVRSMQPMSPWSWSSWPPGLPPWRPVRRRRALMAPREARPGPSGQVTDGSSPVRRDLPTGCTAGRAARGPARWWCIPGALDARPTWTRTTVCRTVRALGPVSVGNYARPRGSLSAAARTPSRRAVATPTPELAASPSAPVAGGRGANVAAVACRLAARRSRRLRALLICPGRGSDIPASYEETTTVHLTALMRCSGSLRRSGDRGDPEPPRCAAPGRPAQPASSATSTLRDEACLRAPPEAAGYRSLPRARGHTHTSVTW